MLRLHSKKKMLTRDKGKYLQYKRQTNSAISVIGSFNRVVFDHHNKFQGFWPMAFPLNISSPFCCPMQMTLEQWLNDYGQVLGDANNFVLSFTTVVHRQVFVSIEVLPFFVPCFDIEVLDVLPWICWALFDRYFVCLCDLVVYQPWGVGDGMNVSLFCMK